MTDILKDWVRDIFIIVTALCFAEIVLPKGSMRKYLKFIFSIIILGVVLSPVAYFTDNGFIPEGMTEEYSQYIETFGSAAEEQSDAGSGLEEVQSLQMKEIYRHKIISEAERAIREYYPETDIESIDVYLGEQRSGDKKELSSVQKIVIKGEDCEYVSNIIRCVSQRLGIEDGIISYEVPEENGSNE